MKKIEVAELSRVNRVTHRMQKGSRLAMFQQHQCIHDAVQEHQRRAREAGKSAEKSSAQLENGLMMDFRAFDVNNEQSMAVREREIAHRLPGEALDALHRKGRP